MLSDAEDSEGELTLTVNEHYASAFQYRKEREELDKLKARYGSDAETDEDISTDSESAESEDEDGEELTPAVDAAILRTLARIRQKDPEIYDPERNIFGEEKEIVTSVAPAVTARKKEARDKAKPLYLRQAALDAVLNPSRAASPELPHAQEQQALRDETIAAFHDAVADEDEDGLLVPREKTQDELQMEDEEYHVFLTRQVGDLRDLVSVDGSREDGDERDADENAAEDRKPDKKKTKKKKKKTAAGGDEESLAEDGKKTKAEKDREFLMNYVLNRGWIDRSAKHIPTYREVTSQEKLKSKSKSKKKAKKNVTEVFDAGSVSSSGPDADAHSDAVTDSSFDSLADIFESSYNHRFEEPDAAQIPSFPRNLPSLVRRMDTTRKEARERRTKRKEEQKQMRRQEVQRMKALKMREIRHKLEKIGVEGGLQTQDGTMDEALQELDLDGEWDPQKHDQQMANLFDGEEAENDIDEGLDLDEDGKPRWKDDIDIGDIIGPATGMQSGSKTEKKKRKKKRQDENDAQAEYGVNVDAMDADVIPTRDDDEEWDGTEEMRKRKLSEYMDEVYALDFNDLVGDLPTRFKYIPVQSQSYSLTPAEILLADDYELNEYVSVKKLAPYRDDKFSRKWDGRRQEKLKELKGHLKERIAQSGFSVRTTNGGANGSQETVKVKKRKGKKERMRLKSEAEVKQVGEPAKDLDLGEEDQDRPAHREENNKRKHDVRSDEEVGDRSGYKKRKHKHKNKEQA